MLLLRRRRLLWLFAWPLYQCLWRGPSATSITCHSSFAQALSYSDRDGCDSATTCRVHERLAALAPFARVSLQRQMSLEELLPLMEGLAHWPLILRSYNLAGRARLSKARSVWPASADQVADWPRLAAAWCSLRRDLALKEAWLERLWPALAGSGRLRPAKSGLRFHMAACP